MIICGESEYADLIAVSILRIRRLLGNFPQAECHRFDNFLEVGRYLVEFSIKEVPVNDANHRLPPGSSRCRSGLLFDIGHLAKYVTLLQGLDDYLLTSH